MSSAQCCLAELVKCGAVYCLYTPPPRTQTTPPTPTPAPDALLQLGIKGIGDDSSAQPKVVVVGRGVRGGGALLHHGTYHSSF